MTIKAIVAVDKEGAIGYYDELLVKLPNDMKRFKELTIGEGNNTILCGSKTYDSMGKLPKRSMVVASRTNDYKGEDVHVTQDIHEFIRRWKEYSLNGDLFICGGSEIYEQTLQYVDELYLTWIAHEFEDANKFFPKLDEEVWETVDVDKRYKDERHPYNYTFWTFKRIKN